MPVLNNRHPIVARCEPLWPYQLAKYEMHRKRTQKKDKEHCDPDRRHLNTTLIGDDDWLKKAQAEIDLMREENFAEKLAAQKRQSRLKEMRATIRKGPEDPWAKSEEGPLREIILTAHHDFFAAADEADERDTPDAGTRPKPRMDPEESDQARAAEKRKKHQVNAREAEFEKVAVAWLNKRFPGAVLQARVDRDEFTFHAHAIVM